MKTKSYGKAIGVFLFFNFFALYLGSFWTSPGVQSEWYQGLNQAPWTPPGWVFGAAWTLIMICFAFYMASLFQRVPLQYILKVYLVQWILNTSWNYFFFELQKTAWALVIISTLTLLILYLFWNFCHKLKAISLLLLPYALWLLLATSLNAYIWWHN